MIVAAIFTSKTPEVIRPGEKVHRALFHKLSLAEHMPIDRTIDRFVYLGGMRRQLAPFHSTMRRPSVMIGMLIVVYAMGIRSELR